MPRCTRGTARHGKNEALGKQMNAVKELMHVALVS